MVVEDVSVDDSPLRPAPALVVRVQCRKAALRCSRCGRKCPKYDDRGGELYFVNSACTVLPWES